MFLVAHLDGEPVGSLVLGGDADLPWLSHLQIAAPWRGHGLGTLLLGAAEEISRSRGAARMGLRVEQGNTRARALYQRLGFVRAGVEGADTVLHKVL